MRGGNYDTLYQNSIRKHSYLNEGWLFIGIFKVRSLPRMINKEVLSQFMYERT